MVVLTGAFVSQLLDVELTLVLALVDQVVRNLYSFV